MFMQPFLQGYKEQCHLEQKWLHHLPFFLNFRQLFSYMYLCSFMNDLQKRNQKIQCILNRMESNIEQNISYIDFDTEKLIK